MAITHTQWFGWALGVLCTYVEGLRLCLGGGRARLALGAVLHAGGQLRVRLLLRHTVRRPTCAALRLHRLARRGWCKPEHTVRQYKLEANRSNCGGAKRVNTGSLNALVEPERARAV
jgi:hypothetical protein